MYLVRNIEKEKAILREIALKYAVAGMVTYVQASGGKIVKAEVNGMTLNFDVEDSGPFIGINEQKLGKVDAWSVIVALIEEEDLSDPEVLEMAVAHLGVEIAAYWATTESQKPVSLSSYQPDFVSSLAWYHSLKETFAGNLGLHHVEPEWMDFVSQVSEHSRLVLRRNWYAVEYYYSKLESEGVIRRFLPQDFDGLSPSPISKSSVKSLCSEIGVLTDLLVTGD